MLRSGSSTLRIHRFISLLVLGGAVLAPAIAPGEASAQVAARGGGAIRLLPPRTPGAIGLFSGSPAELNQNFSHTDGSPATWSILEDRSMVARNGDIMTRQGFRDFQLHVEFRVPYMPNARGQQRGNSGIFLHGRFEMQILDSHGIASPGPGDCGAVYNTHAPLVNACKAPNEWQSYDIIFRAPRFDDDGKRTEMARVTAYLNGTLVQNNVEIPNGTGSVSVGDPRSPAPIILQYHAAPVQFRSIWILPLNQLDPAAAAAPTTDATTAPVTDDATAPPAIRDEAAGTDHRWQDVPKGQHVGIQLASFDQGGYRLETNNGQAIQIPFIDQNLNAMKFGRSATGESYFVNDGAVPVLYVNPDTYLTNTAAQDSRWFPITQDYRYTDPVYVSPAPSWSDYVRMGWYPGMTVYGGMYGYTLNGAYSWMPGYSTSINGFVMRSYPVYRNYYLNHPGYVVSRRVVRQQPSRFVPLPPVQRSAYPIIGQKPPYTPILPRRSVSTPPLRQNPQRFAPSNPAGSRAQAPIQRQVQRPPTVPQPPPGRSTPIAPARKVFPAPPNTGRVILPVVQPRKPVIRKRVR